ncbi:MAG TPA: hypothetical protein VGM01_13320, partial [Ktedonobacteraceae bacterium]
MPDPTVNVAALLARAGGAGIGPSRGPGLAQSQPPPARTSSAATFTVGSGKLVIGMLVNVYRAY